MGRCENGFSEMKAKCPYCYGKGCIKCVEGYSQVAIASGRLYTRKCKNPKCGFENGGFIIGPKAYPESKLLQESEESCVMCNADIEYVEIGHV